MEQASDQSRSDFLDAVVKACSDSEILGMTMDQLMVHNVLAGLADQDTKEKLQELENLSFKELQHEAKRLDIIKVKVQHRTTSSIA